MRGRQKSWRKGGREAEGEGRREGGREAATDGRSV